MQQTYKQRQKTKRVAEEVELSVPDASLRDTSDAAELIAAIDALLEA
jgi:hypothetical protein